MTGSARPCKICWTCIRYAACTRWSPTWHMSSVISLRVEFFNNIFVEHYYEKPTVPYHRYAIPGGLTKYAERIRLGMLIQPPTIRLYGSQHAHFMDALFTHWTLHSAFSCIIAKKLTATDTAATLLYNSVSLLPLGNVSWLFSFSQPLHRIVVYRNAQCLPFTISVHISMHKYAGAAMLHIRLLHTFCKPNVVCGRPSGPVSDC